MDGLVMVVVVRLVVSGSERDVLGLPKNNAISLEASLVRDLG